jgi:hypothetical protein
MVTVKLSLGIFFLRIMELRWQQISVRVILVLSTAVGIAYFLFALFECGFPVDSLVYWQRFFAEKCVGPKAILGMSYTHSIITVGTDLLLLVLAMRLLIGLPIKNNEKRIVVVIFVLATA